MDEEGGRSGKCKYRTGYIESTNLGRVVLDEVPCCPLGELQTGGEYQGLRAFSGTVGDSESQPYGLARLVRIY